MVMWLYLLGISTVLSYLSDVGILSLHDIKVPFCNASMISILILLCFVGLLGRLMQMAKKGEKERLREELKVLQEKNK